MSMFKKRRRGGTIGPHLDEWQEFALLHPRHGSGPLSLATQFGEDWEDDVRALWSLHGDRLTHEWALARERERKFVGSRPALWWALTVGESRRIVRPDPNPVVEARVVDENTFFGVLCHPLNVHHAGGLWLFPWDEHLRELGERN